MGSSQWDLIGDHRNGLQLKGIPVDDEKIIPFTLVHHAEIHTRESEDGTIKIRGEKLKQKELLTVQDTYQSVTAHAGVYLEACKKVKNEMLKTWGDTERVMELLDSNGVDADPEAESLDFKKAMAKMHKRHADSGDLAGAAIAAGSQLQRTKRMFLHADADHKKIAMAIEADNNNSANKEIPMTYWIDYLSAPEGCSYLLEGYGLMWEHIQHELMLYNIEREKQDKNKKRTHSGLMKEMQTDAQRMAVAAYDTGRLSFARQYTRGITQWKEIAAMSANVTNRNTRRWNSLEAEALLTKIKAKILNQPGKSTPIDTSHREIYTDPRGPFWTLLFHNVFSFEVIFSRIWEDESVMPVAKHSNMIREDINRPIDHAWYFKKDANGNYPDEAARLEPTKRLDAAYGRAFKKHIYIDTPITFANFEDGARENIYWLKPTNYDGDSEWHIRKMSFGRYLSAHITRLQNTRLSNNTTMAPNSMGHKPDVYTDNDQQGVSLDLLSNTVMEDDGQKPSRRIEIDMTQHPIAERAERTKALMKSHHSTLKQLRQGAIKNTFTEAYQIQIGAADALMSQMASDDMTPRGTKSMLEYINDPSQCGLFGKASEVQRHVRDFVFATDMSNLSNMVQWAFTAFEILDVSTMHGPMFQVWISHLCSMDPAKGLYPNIEMYGAGMTGKSFLVWLLFLIAVKGSVTSTQYATLKAFLAHDTSRMHETEVNLENLNKILADKEAGEQGSIEENSWKEAATSNIKQTSTAAVDNGVRTTVDHKAATHGSDMWFNNLVSTKNIAGPTKSRLLLIEALMLLRQNKSAADKIAYEARSKANRENDVVRNSTIGEMKRIQCFIFLWLTMIECGGVMRIDMTAFVVVQKLLSEVYEKHNMTIDCRKIEMAERIAKVLTVMSWYFDWFMLFAGRFSEQSALSVMDIINEEHLLDTAGVCTEETATVALNMVLGNISNQNHVSAVCKGIIHLLGSKGYEWSKVFGVADCNTNSRNSNHDLLGTNLAYITFEIPNSSRGKDGLTAFYQLIAEAMLQSTGSSMTAGQVGDILQSIKNDKQYNRTTHGSFDIMLPPCTGIKQPAIWEKNLNISLETLKKRYTDNGDEFVMKASYLKAAQVEWLKRGAFLPEEASDPVDALFFPYEIPGSQQQTENTLIETEARSKGSQVSQIRISLKFVLGAVSDSFTKNFEKSVRQGLNTCHTVAAEQVIAPVSMTQIISPETCALVRSDRAQQNQREVVITNQDYLSANLSSALGFRGVRDDHRLDEDFAFENNVPLDTQICVKHLRFCWENLGHKVVPSAAKLLSMDLNGITYIFAPGILVDIYDSDPQFRKLVATPNPTANNMDQRRTIIKTHIQSKYMDLLQDTFDGKLVGSTKHKVYNKRLAKHTKNVLDLSTTKGIGRIRSAALNAPTNATVKREAVQLKRLYEQMKAINFKGSRLKPQPVEDTMEPEAMANALQYNILLKRFKYITSDELFVKRLAQMQSKIQQHSKLSKEAHMGSSVDMSFTSFIDEYKSIKREGAHGFHEWVDYIRQESAALMKEWYDTDTNPNGWVAKMKARKQLMANEMQMLLN